MDKQFAYTFFAIQFVGAMLILCLSVFFAGAGGGLDLTGYEVPGFSGIFLLLPIVFPLTLLTYIGYSKLKNQTLASLLLLFAFVSNIVFVIEVIRVLLGWFR